MSSARRINANKRNARRSTGPRSPTGKAAVRLNSLTHGAFAADLLLPGEDAPAFRRLEASFLAHYKPATPDGVFFVHRMILASWRLLRMAAMETRVLRSKVEDVMNDVGYGRALGDYLSPPDPDDPPRPDPEPPTDPLARAWIRDTARTNALSRLARYQVQLERSFYRAHTLFSEISEPQR